MRILITGASGFVGQGLIEYFKNKKINVFEGLRNKVSKKNTKHVNLGEINSKSNFKNNLNNFDVVVHSAGIAHQFYLKDNNNKNVYDEVNYLGTINLANQCSRAGVKKFIFLSTIKVNGEFTSKENFFTIFDNPQPKDEYALSKFKAENELLKIFKNKKMEIVILRLPLVYGKNVKANFLDFIKIIDKNILLPFGSIQNSRSLIFIENLADIVFKCIKNKKVNGKVYLVSDGEDISISDLIFFIQKGIQTKAYNIKCPIILLKIIFYIFRKNEKIKKLLHSLKIDNSEIVKDLNWVAPFSVKAGLNKTCKWYKSIK